MTSYVSAALRRQVIERASGLCEYCLIAEEDTWLGCEVDHVISEKHGGQTASENLAMACATCNRAKGSDLGSIAGNGAFIRFFNPRIDHWGVHFGLDEAIIVAKSLIGEVTARIFQFNSAERLVERDYLCELGRYPPRSAANRIVAVSDMNP